MPCGEHSHSAPLPTAATAKPQHPCICPCYSPCNEYSLEHLHSCSTDKVSTKSAATVLQLQSSPLDYGFDHTEIGRPAREQHRATIISMDGSGGGPASRTPREGPTGTEALPTNAPGRTRELSLRGAGGMQAPLPCAERGAEWRGIAASTRGQVHEAGCAGGAEQEGLLRLGTRVGGRGVERHWLRTYLASAVRGGCSGSWPHAHRRCL